MPTLDYENPLERERRLRKMRRKHALPWGKVISTSIFTIVCVVLYFPFRSQNPPVPYPPVSLPAGTMSAISTHEIIHKNKNDLNVLADRLFQKVQEEQAVQMVEHSGVPTRAESTLLLLMNHEIYGSIGVEDQIAFRQRLNENYEEFFIELALKTSADSFYNQNITLPTTSPSVSP